MALSVDLVLCSKPKKPEHSKTRGSSLVVNVLGFDSEANRYRIVLEDLGEIIRVKPEALGKCLFPGCFRDGPTIAAAT